MAAGGYSYESNLESYTSAICMHADPFVYIILMKLNFSNTFLLNHEIYIYI